ncbi:hypothetical protein JXL83_09510 [candidate division WOR-3 bacterium]|nr:hypothetical protein [candidate division WOR-3 bacterium]
MILTFIIFFTVCSKTVLFDQSHSQTNYSSYDFIVDDNSPIPQPYPPSGPNSWNGQLSTWAYEIYLMGHSVRINTDYITSSTFNGVDLFIIPEPQDTFSVPEMDAIENFVLSGGSLLIIADHNGSDRNANGWDSPSIFDGYTQPHITTFPGNDPERFIKPRFGMHLHVKGEGNNSITGSWTNVSSLPDDPIINGPFGKVDTFTYHVGNVFSVFPGINASLDSLRGHIWKNMSPQDTTLIIVVTCKAGSGKVGGVGDSSPCCDGSGPTSHENNWIEHDNRELFLNLSTWLLEQETAVEECYACFVDFSLSASCFYKPFLSKQNIFLSDVTGRVIFSTSPTESNNGFTRYQLPSDLRPSVYFISSSDVITCKFVVLP